MGLKTSFGSGVGIAVAASALFFSVTPASAMIGLKQVQVASGQIDLLFDGKIAKNQIKTEFFNDIVQLSLNDTAVYPAKISTINGVHVTKIFAYQYAPKLVRCRFTVKGKAENYKDRLQLIPNGKLLTIRFGGDATTDKIVSQAAQATREFEEEPTALAKAASVPVAKVTDPEEQKLLEKVLKAEKAQDKAADRGAPVQQASAPLTGGPKQLASAKPLTSPLRAFAKFIAVLAVMGGMFLGGRKLFRGNSALSRFAKNGLNKKQKMIEVVQTHYLGPKKSIAVVRIAGRMMVLGVTDESINLITQISSDSDSPMGMDVSELEELGLRVGPPAGASAKNNGPDIFADILGKETRKPAIQAPINNSPLKAASMYAATASTMAPAGMPATDKGVRAQIRSRLEGFKQL